MSTGSVVIAGAVARRLHAGGHVWALLHWVLGFRALGWKVVFVDRLDEPGDDRSAARQRAFAQVMEGLGLEGCWGLDLGPGRPWVGMGRSEVRRRIEAADLLLNVMGYLEDPDLLGAARLRAFLDIDPGFGQMWRALEMCDLFAGHDRLVTVGTALGRPGCRVPAGGLEWIPTLPPVLPELWDDGEDDPPAGRPWTSVGAWRGPWAPVEYGGERFGLRVHEFRRFARLPRRAVAPLEVALDVDAVADAADIRALRAGGWRVVDPGTVAGTPAAYRRYLRTSRGEFGIAKEMYVRGRSGWFSDRTACYLAAGRPAVVQGTGVRRLPVGRGLLTFDDPAGAAAALAEVEGDWDRHSRAARDVALAHLDARVVLPGLVDALLGEPARERRAS